MYYFHDCDKLVIKMRVLGSWKNHQSLKIFGVRAEMGPFYCLRHRMLHFLQNFVYYVTLEVINQRGHEFQVGMQDARDMDEVVSNS